MGQARLDKEPLYGCGWVLQERLFSRRTLNFGTLFVWECKTKTLHEYDTVDVLGLDDTGRSVKNTFNDLCSTANKSLGFIKTWNKKVVKPYTEAQLTHQSDRLVAISGIIRRIQRDTGWTNIYGLWKPWLPEQLLWGAGFTEGVLKNIPRTRTGWAPTWSWASVNAPVWPHIANPTPSRNHYIVEEAP